MKIIEIFCNSCGEKQGEYEDEDDAHGMFCVCSLCAGPGPRLSPQNYRPIDHQAARDKQSWHQKRNK